VQQYRIGTVEKRLRGSFEVGGLRIEHGEIEIRFDETQNAVRLDDHVLR